MDILIPMTILAQVANTVPIQPGEPKLRVPWDITQAAEILRLVQKCPQANTDTTSMASLVALEEPTPWNKSNGETTTTTAIYALLATIAHLPLASQSYAQQALTLQDGPKPDAPNVLMAMPVH